jgi:carbon monoxide dehydrogenase subunit G
MKISSIIEINSTPQEVFTWLENPEKARVWMTSVSEGEILRETVDRVGTTFREVVEDEDGSIEMHGMITGFETDKSIAFHLESRVNTVDVEYRVEKTVEGARLDYHADIEWKFPMNIISLIMGKKIRQNIIGQLAGELNQLKELCESDISSEGEML